MKKRYSVGFADPGIKCSVTESNPDFIPVVDTEGVGYFGEAIAFCLDKEAAKKIVEALNSVDIMEKFLNS